jgi:hypothetical protein
VIERAKLTVMHGQLADLEQWCPVLRRGRVFG